MEKLEEHLIECNVNRSNVVKEDPLEIGDSDSIKVEEVFMVKVEDIKEEYEEEEEEEEDVKDLDTDEGDIKIKRMCKPFTCSYCLYITVVPEEFVSHVKTHTQSNYFICGECGRTGTYRKCMTIYVGPNNFLCLYCENVTTKRQLKHWIYCTSCGYKYSRSTYTDTAHRNICAITVKPFKCTFCEFECSNQTAFTEHAILHMENMAFPCNICNFRTDTWEKLKTHIFVHKPCACKICDYRTTSIFALKVHLRKVHSVGKPPVVQNKRRKYKTKKTCAKKN